MHIPFCLKSLITLPCLIRHRKAVAGLKAEIGSVNAEITQERTSLSRELKALAAMLAAPPVASKGEPR